MKGFHFAISLLLCWTSLHPLLAIQIGSAPEVQTRFGPVRGLRHEFSNGVSDVYLGIPFATPPVGPYRFVDPKLPQPWSEPLLADKFSPGCYQDCNLGPEACPKNISEDCLYLNIFTPASSSSRSGSSNGTANAAALPVMFWIHGGAFFEGTASCKLFYGTFLSNAIKQVVVTINYRLDIFGFLVTPTQTGNYGLKDQRLAMQWVKENIAGFGGDPNQITIFGESAGGMSVSTHLVSSLSKDLFQRALMESNPIDEAMAYEFALYEGKKFAQNVNCDPSDLKCLQAVDAATVLKEKGTIWEATIDAAVQGGNLPDYPLLLIEKGLYNRVPVIIGNNKEEMAFFVRFSHPRPMDADAYIAQVTKEFPDNYQDVLKLYPAQDNYDNRITLSYLKTHQSWSCPAARMILAINKYNPRGMQGFLYYFDHPSSVNGGLCAEAVCHAEELVYVWGTQTYATDGLQNLTAAEQILSSQIMKYWGQFSLTGNPSFQGQVTWPAFTIDKNTSMVLDVPNVYASDGHLQKYCDFWDPQAL